MTITNITKITKITITNITNLATHIRLLFLAQLFFALTFLVTLFNGTEALVQSTWSIIIIDMITTSLSPTKVNIH